MGKEQQELDNMPKKDDLAIAGEKYLYAKDEVERLKGNLDIAKEELISIMKKLKRSSITVEGKTLRYSTSEKEIIHVTQD